MSGSSDDRIKNIDREQLIKYLADNQALWRSYHDHKENSAWAGLLLYAFIQSQLVLNASYQRPLSLVEIMSYSLAVLAAAAITLYLLSLQLGLRRTGAHFVAACNSIRWKVISDPGFEMNPETPIDPGPNASRDAIRYLPVEVLREASRFAEGPLNFRKSLEMCVYGFYSLITVFALSWLFIIGPESIAS